MISSSYHCTQKISGLISLIVNLVCFVALVKFHVMIRMYFVVHNMCCKYRIHLICGIDVVTFHLVVSKWDVKVPRIILELKPPIGLILMKLGAMATGIYVYNSLAICPHEDIYQVRSLGMVQIKFSQLTFSGI